MAIGIDLEETERFKDKDLSFLKSIFTQKELDYCFQKKEPWISLTGKFCAKEATIKALDNPLDVKEIEILNNSEGKPEIFINNEKRKLQCSISHTKYIVMLLLYLLTEIQKECFCRREIFF